MTPVEDPALSTSKDVVRRHFREAINSHDATIYDDIMADDFTLTVGLRSDLLAGGHAGSQAGLTAFWAAFPDMRVEVLDLIAEGDHVVANYIERATFTGHYARIPPTGRSYEKHGFGLYTIVDGRLTSGWVQEDDLTFAACTGIDPMPSVAAELESRTASAVVRSISAERGVSVIARRQRVGLRWSPAALSVLMNRGH